MNMNNNSFSNIYRQRAFKYGLWGMLASFLWLLITLCVMYCFQSSTFESIIRTLNYPVFYLLAGRIFDTMVQRDLINEHNFAFFLLVLFVAYIGMGFLLGICYYAAKNVISKIILGRKGG